MTPMTECEALDSLARHFDWPEGIERLDGVLLVHLSDAGFERDQLEGLGHITRKEWAQRRDELRAADPVNHPAHYQSEDGIECIDAIRAALGLEGFVAHCRGTAIKYAWRAGSKGEAAECLRKGAWYLTKAAEELEK